MALLTATDAAAFLGINRRSLGRHRAALAERGLAQLVGARWMYESEALREAWLELAHHQVANSATLDRLAREVKTGGYAAKAREFWLEFGQWRPDESLTDDESWEHAATIAAAMVGVSLTPRQVDALLDQLDEARHDVSLGARWDASKWAAASARLEAEEAIEPAPL